MAPSSQEFEPPANPGWFHPLFEHLYPGMPWTEIDYLIGVGARAPLSVRLSPAFPEVQAVSTRVLSTPHGLGHSKPVIVVDESAIMPHAPPLNR
jgi:hypothetical protein